MNPYITPISCAFAGNIRKCAYCRAARAIGFIDMMIDYSLENAPTKKELTVEEIGNVAAFLVSPFASAITGAVIFEDNGLNTMGAGVETPVFKDLDIPKAKQRDPSPPI